EMLWSSEFDRSLSVSNLLQVQSEVAREVARALRVEPEAVVTGDRGNTSDLDAYQEFVQAQLLWDRIPEPEYRRRVIEHLEVAVRLDPDFGQAWALLSSSYSMRAGTDRLPGLDQRAYDALLKARSLVGEVPETRVAAGLYDYYVERRYRGALDSLSLIRPQLPNDMALMAVMFLLHRRLGEWAPALALAQDAVATNPRSLLPLALAASAHRALRDYAGAERVIRTMLAVAPDAPLGAVHSRFLHLATYGDTMAARLAEESSPVPLGPSDFGTVVSTTSERDVPVLSFMRRDFQESGRYWVAAEVDNAITRRNRLYWLAISARAAGDEATARRWADSLVAVGAGNGEVPNPGPVTRQFQAIGHALLGRTDEAVRIADDAFEEIKRNEGAFSVTTARRRLAMILLLADERDRLFSELARSLGEPSFLTRGFLAVDPRFDPVKEDPRFTALLAGAGT
ncbi:MAG: tetratricopeptide repeat protein, partial [Longimicrobiales bacterium]